MLSIAARRCGQDVVWDDAARRSVWMAAFGAQHRGAMTWLWRGGPPLAAEI